MWVATLYPAKVQYIPGIAKDVVQQSTPRDSRELDGAMAQREASAPITHIAVPN